MQAFKWHLLAWERDNSSAIFRLVYLAVFMSSEEVAEAGRLAAEWSREHAAVD